MSSAPATTGGGAGQQGAADEFINADLLRFNRKDQMQRDFLAARGVDRMPAEPEVPSSEGFVQAVRAKQTNVFRERFRDVDVLQQAKRRREEHAAKMVEGGVWTPDEARDFIGRDAVDVPGTRTLVGLLLTGTRPMPSIVASPAPPQNPRYAPPSFTNRFISSTPSLPRDFTLFEAHPPGTNSREYSLSPPFFTSSERIRSQESPADMRALCAITPQRKDSSQSSAADFNFEFRIILKNSISTAETPRHGGGHLGLPRCLSASVCRLSAEDAAMWLVLATRSSSLWCRVAVIRDRSHRGRTTEPQRPRRLDLFGISVTLCSLCLCVSVARGRELRREPL